MMTRRMNIVVLAGAACLVAARVLLAQTPTHELPRFDVVSIKPWAEASGRAIEWTPGRFVARGSPMVGLVNMAHGRPLRLSGGPDWFRTTFWDITATFDPARVVTVEQRAPMIMALLEDKFRLVLRSELRDSPVYRLVLARSDGKLGTSLRTADLPCDAPGRPKFSPNLPAPGQRPACNILVSMLTNMGAVLGGNVPISRLAGTLGSLVQRDVIDGTGLTGEFDVVLTFARDSAIRSSPFPPGGAPATEPAISEAPSIFTAVQEQLGLKLESTRAPLEFHIVERAELPPPN